LEDAGAAETAHEGAAPLQDRRTTILIVEDNLLFRQVVTQELRSHFPRTEILEAEDVPSGRWKARHYAPALAFVDIHLPGGSGLSLVAEIKRDVPCVTIVVWTSDDIPEYREAAVRRGAAHFLVKDRMSAGDIFLLAEEAIRRRERRNVSCGG
jgi:DNA-binding NarL/FixJ family response regulator